MFCQYSSSWPEEAREHLFPDNKGNGYYDCCDTYLCTQNEDGSFVDINEARANAPTNAPTPLPSQSPTTSPSLSPIRMPSASPSTSPTKLPTQSPSGSPTKLSSVTTTSSTTSSSTDGKWYPATVNAERTCKFGSDYPAVYAEYGFLYEDDVDENGKITKSGEQKCCDKYVLQCRFKFLVKDDMWYPTISSVTGKKTCDYGNGYPDYYSTNGMLFLNETA